MVEVVFTAQLRDSAKHDKKILAYYYMNVYMYILHIVIF